MNEFVEENRDTFAHSPKYLWLETRNISLAAFRFKCLKIDKYLKVAMAGAVLGQSFKDAWLRSQFPQNESSPPPTKVETQIRVIWSALVSATGLITTDCSAKDCLSRCEETN